MPSTSFSDSCLFSHLIFLFLQGHQFFLHFFVISFRAVHDPVQNTLTKKNQQMLLQSLLMQCLFMWNFSGGGKNEKLFTMNKFLFFVTFPDWRGTEVNFAGKSLKTLTYINFWWNKNLRKSSRENKFLNYKWLSSHFHIGVSNVKTANVGKI